MQKRLEHISGIEDQQFPTRFSISSSDGEVLMQVEISFEILQAMFQEKNSKTQLSGKGGVNGAGSLFQVCISTPFGKLHSINSLFNIHLKSDQKKQEKNTFGLPI